MRYKEDNQLNKHLGKTPFLSLPFTPDTSPPLLSLSPLPWLSPQVPLCPWGETVLVQELGVGARRFLSAAPSSSFCSHVGPSTGHRPLKGVPAPLWAPSEAAVLSGVSLLWCGEPPSRSASPAASPAMPPSPCLPLCLF